MCGSNRSTMNGSSSHISIETLADLAEDRLESKAREAALVHLSTCPACDSALLQVRNLTHLMRSDRPEDVPGEVLNAAIEIFSRPLQLTAPSSLRRIVATLTFDSFKSTPAFGMRSGQTSSRQLLYSAEESDLDLRITVQNDQCVVAGQVLRDGCIEGLVEISGASGSAETSLNELCEFIFPALPLGNYQLRVKMGDVEIEVPELEFTA
jgi:hypothetical protein